MTLNGMKIKLSGAKNQKLIGSDSVGRILDESASCGHRNYEESMNMIRQRLQDIELQRWQSELNNDIRKDANQSSKMRTYRKFKTKDTIVKITYTGHQYVTHNSSNKTVTKQPQISHRDRTSLETV